MERGVREHSRGTISRQKMALRHSRPLISPTASTADLNSKLEKLFSRHEQLKISYLQLKSQINTGLLQAEEVFASLAIPLMKLVGLKTVEMANEGRFTTIIIDNDLNHRDGAVASGVPDRSNHICAFQGENFASRAAIAGKELIEKRRIQFVQLVKLLRQIETLVNSSQDEILQNVDDHHVFLQNFIQKSIYFVSSLDREKNDTILITVKLLQSIFHNLTTMLRSVKGGVEGMIRGLSQQMCTPMVAYVNGLKDDISETGTCMRLLAIVNDIEKVMEGAGLELKDAQKKAKVAEEGKIEALCKLKEKIECMRKMKEDISYCSEAKRGTIESSFSQKILGMEEDRAKDDKLLWEILRKKRKHEVPESPMGPEALLYCHGTKDCWNSKEVRPLINHRPVTRSRTAGCSPQTPLLNARIPLGSSPSAVNHRAVSLRRSAR